MIIKFKGGSQTLKQLEENINKVVYAIIERAGLEEGTGIKLRDVQVGVTLNIDGEDKYVTVDHEGVTAIFEVHVGLDEEGNIEVAKDNEVESFMDDYSRSVANGVEKEYDVIESIYDMNDLKEVATLDGGDMVEKTFTHVKDDSTIIQYYKNGNLVGELALPGNKDK